MNRPALSVCLALALGAGCSVALDFDRTYPKPESANAWPGAFLKDPNPGEKPFEGAQLATACDSFCDAYLECLGQKDICHYIWALPEDSSNPEIASRDALASVCVEACKADGTLVQSQLTSVADNRAECNQVARAVVQADPQSRANCDVLKHECEALCEPGSGGDSIAKCYTVTKRNIVSCSDNCENQGLEYLYCVQTSQPQEVEICTRTAACDQFYRPPTDMPLEGRDND